MMKKYDSYKNSGIVWVGEIPEHWEVKKLKYAVAIINDKGNAAEFTHKAALENIESFTGKLLDKELSFDFSGGGSLFKAGDVLFNKLRPYLAKVYLAKEEGISGGELLVLRPNDYVCSDFIFYRLLSKEFINEVDSSTYGTKMPRANWDFIGQLKIALPPLKEQYSIAQFLNSKISEIDSLIQKKQQLIDLLEEEKVAVINEAVTKGLNPYASMKDSGIECLSMIPAHWEVKKLKHIATVKSGFALNGSMGGENSIKLPYLRVANVQDGFLKLDNINEVEIGETIAHRYLLQPGDLLMNEGGDNDKLGRGCVWRGEIDPCLHQNHVFAVRMKSNADPDWVNALTLTVYARQYFMVHCKQSTNLASISQTNIKELPVLMPPSTEILDILKFIESHIAKINLTVSHAKKEIELLQEFRTALISEAVTGKIDVRDYQPGPITLKVLA